MHALDGVRILDLSGGIAGPLGVLQLAEHGADVIKIEPPGGSAARRSPASPRLQPEPPLGHARPAATPTARASSASCAPPPTWSSRRSRRGRWPSGASTTSRSATSSRGSCTARCRRGRRARASRTCRATRRSCTRAPGSTGRRPASATGRCSCTARSRASAPCCSSRSGSCRRSSRVTAPVAANTSRCRCSQGVLSLTTQIWNWTDQGQFQLREDAPAGHPPGVDLRVRRRGVDPRARCQAGVTPTRSEASVLGLEEVAFADAVRDESRRSAPTTPSAGGTAFKRRDRAELVDELHDAGLGAEAIVAPHERFDHPQLRATGLGGRGRRPRGGSDDAGRRDHLPRRARRARCAARSRWPARTPTRCSAPLGLRRRRARRAAAARE